MLGGITLIKMKCGAKKCGKPFLAEGNASPKDTCCTHCGSKKYDFQHDAPARNIVVF